jgi:hypothetical protein
MTVSHVGKVEEPPVPCLMLPRTRVPFSRRTQRAGANLRAKTAIRGASSSSILAWACGSGTRHAHRHGHLPHHRRRGLAVRPRGRLHARAERAHRRVILMLAGVAGLPGLTANGSRSGHLAPGRATASPRPNSWPRPQTHPPQHVAATSSPSPPATTSRPSQVASPRTECVVGPRGQRAGLDRT